MNQFEKLLGLGKYADVIELAQKSPNATESRFYQASALWRLGRLDEALDFAIKNMFYELADDWKIKNLNLIGNLYGEKGDLEKAYKYYNNVLEVSTKISDTESKANSLNNMGTIHYLKGELGEAENFYNESLQLYDKVNNNQASSNTLQNLGSIYRVKGELNKALEDFQQSIKILNGFEDKRAKADQLISMGVIYREKGELSESVSNLKLGLKLREELGNEINIAEALMELVITLIEIQDGTMANEYMSKMTKINNEVPNDFIQLYYKFTQAVFLKNLPRNKEKVKAQQLFEEIIRTNDLNFNITIKSISHVIEFLITEYQVLNESMVLDEINQYISKLRQITLSQNIYSTYIDILILESKISLVMNDIQTSAMTLQNAFDFAEERGLLNYLNIIRSEMESIKSYVEKSTKIMQDYNLSHEIENLGILEYLKKVQTLKNELDYEM